MKPNKLIYFLQRESSQDALRNILTILIPSILVFFLYNLSIAIAFGVGIILSALTDVPGNLKDKRLTALICIPAFFIAGICASFGLIHLPWLIIPILALFGFICNYVLVLGPRIGAIGNLTLIVISFTLGLQPANVIPYSLALTSGAATFFAVSVFQAWLFPTRSLQHAMDDGFENMANLIRLKVKCYSEDLPLDQVYKELSVFHVKVSEQLEIVRALLLKEENIQTINASQHTIWINKIYRLIDLYELLMANDYDYDTIRQQLVQTNTLPTIRRILVQLANETEQISSNIGISKKRRNFTTLQKDIQSLKVQITTTNEENAKILYSILDHIEHIQNIIHNATSAEVLSDATWISQSNYKSFTSSQISWNTIKSHLTSKSPVFLYSIRMSLLLSCAGIFGYLLPEFRYASWVILTIILVARPSYLITKKRNFQRIIGSILGLIISLITLYFVTNTASLLILAAISLYLFYLFNKPNYLICVIFITITIMISLNIYEGNIFDLFGSRFAFTLLGSLFAILGCLIIPINHLKTVENVSQNLIGNYKKYLEKIDESSSTNTIDFYQLRLVRKNAQTSLAQFYDAIEQFVKDPRNKLKNNATINHFETVAYRINALLIGLSVSISKSTTETNLSQLQPKISSINILIDELDELAHDIIIRKN